MIVRMSKIEIVGAKELLQSVLTLLRELGIFQIEPATIGFVEEGREHDVRSFMPDEKVLGEQLFLGDLRKKIEELFSFLPKKQVRKSYIEPRTIIDIIAKTIERHIANNKEISERIDALQKERTDLDRYSIFLSTLAQLVHSTRETPDLDFIGLTIREPEMVEHLREAISRITDWKFELMTDKAEDGTLVGLITVEKDLSEKVKKSLSDEHVPELIFPPSFSGLSFVDKVAFVNKRITEVSLELERIENEQSRFAQRWIPIYQNVKEWIDDRLALIATTMATFETRMCFFINGWMASGTWFR